MGRDDDLKQLSQRIDRLEASLGQQHFSFGPIVDPPPWGGPYPWPPWPRPLPLPQPIPFPSPSPIADPPPIDLARLSRTQLESALHRVKAEITRLDSLEKMIEKQIKGLEG